MVNYDDRDPTPAPGPDYTDTSEGKKTDATNDIYLNLWRFGS